MQILATFDSKGLSRDIKTLLKLSSKSDQLGAMSRSLSRAGQSMTKQAVTEVQIEINLKTSPLRKVVELKRVQRGTLQASLRIRAVPQPVIDFKGTRQVAKGLSVKIKKGGSRKIIRGGFIATVGGTKRSGFQRKDLGGGKRVGRLPIDVVYSTSVRQVLEDGRRRDRILAAGRLRFLKEFRHELTRRLSNKAGRRG